MLDEFFLLYATYGVNRDTATWLKDALLERIKALIAISNELKDIHRKVSE